MPKVPAKRNSDPTNRERQGRYRQRMRAAGFVRQHVWVPAGELERFRRYVERLCRTREEAQP
jgi:hypothetical protein